MEEPPRLFEIDVNTPESDIVDNGLAAVERWFRREKAMEIRFAAALRQSIDEVLDGQRTGRFDANTLEKTEKTYLGTKVEIVVRSEFGLDRGMAMDYQVDGHDVDAKFTMRSTWTIPREAMGHICLVMSADDRRSTFNVGLVRIAEEILNLGQNQDKKRTISGEGRTGIRWLVRNGVLPRNLLLHMSPVDRTAVFEASAGHRNRLKGGQLRINELLRRFQQRLIDRTAAVTVASQLDGPKRIRDARRDLREEGIVVLGHQKDHPRIARSLDLHIPPKGSWVAVRLVRQCPDDTRPAVAINGQQYVIALPDEPLEPAPERY